jgi:hypothetical protein
LEFFSASGSNSDVLKFLESKSVASLFEAGVNELSEVVKGISNLGVPSDFYGIDLSISGHAKLIL